MKQTKQKVYSVADFFDWNGLRIIPKNGGV